MMAQLADVFITILSLSALVLISSILLGRLLYPIPKGITITIHSESQGANLEQAVRSMIWLRSMGLLSCPIVLVDDGLDSTGLDIARRLCVRWPSVVLHTAQTT